MREGAKVNSGMWTRKCRIKNVLYAAISWNSPWVANRARWIILRSNCALPLILAWHISFELKTACKYIKIKIIWKLDEMQLTDRQDIIWCKNEKKKKKQTNLQALLPMSHKMSLVICEAWGSWDDNEICESSHKENYRKKSIYFYAKSKKRTLWWVEQF